MAERIPTEKRINKCFELYDRLYSDFKNLKPNPFVVSLLDELDQFQDPEFLKGLKEHEYSFHLGRADKSAEIVLAFLTVEREVQTKTIIPKTETIYVN
jgi:hypothetical protein